MSLGQPEIDRLRAGLTLDNQNAVYVAGKLNALTDGCTTTTFGVFGVTAVVRTAAFTQTYATATHTHANITTTSPSTTLVLSATGIAAATPSLTLTDAVNTNAGTVATSLNQAQKDIGTAFNTLRTELAAVVADVLNIKQVLNAVIDDHQLYGLYQ